MCARGALTMPELPEVETVRRGLAPVMEGARFVKVEARRGDLRWPLPTDFAARSDQRVVAGLGNIYVCEALHRARLSPKRRASTIATRSGKPNEHAARLVEGIRNVLHAAIKAGGSSLRDHRRTDGELGLYQHN